ncbi:MAG TPA: methyltransferase [Burkholderiales bacterium]|jgi:ubiquinone/menaquinone biosynthesis C-methylase UbiE|nr:methyltransferase [Burkholderiales bacterium]
MDQAKVKQFFDGNQYLENSHDRIVIRSLVVKDFLGRVENSRILDIGCGDGSLSLPLLNETNRMTLVDISDSMIRKAAARVPAALAANVTLINDSFEAIGDGERFDVILCVGVIAHVASVAALFAKIAKLLAPGGRLVVETTPKPFPLGKLLFPYYYLRNRLSANAAVYAKNRLTLPALLDYARGMGLEQLRAVRYSFPLPGMSHWPQSLKLRYTLFTLNNPLMSRFGSEHVLLFRRAPQ